MSNEKVLSIDCGTQSIRAMIFDKKGNLLAKTSRVFEPPYFSEKAGWAERDANLYWEDLRIVVKELKKDYQELFDELSGMTITTQRDTCVLVDDKGEVIRPAILWLDQRKLPRPKSMHLAYKFGSKIIGMNKVIDSFNRNCHAHWIQEMEPEIWDKTHKYLLLSTFLIFKLSGEYIDSTSAQVGHMPFNYKKKRWEGSLGLKSDIFQIPKDKLYPIVEATSIMGYITEKAHRETGIGEGMPIIASGSDKACETLGVGCIDEMTASISLGSQATIETSTKRYYEVMKFIPPFPGVEPDTYNPEINVYRGYWMVSWFKNEFALEEVLLSKESNISPEEILNKGLESIPAGSEGLILQPYWGNEILKPESRGAIIGFNDSHTKLHIYRGIIEGIGYALFDGLQLIEKKSGSKIKRIALSGGGAKSKVIAQITADIFNRQVYTVQTNETSGLGSAIAVFVGLGIYNNFSEAIENMVHQDSTFYPDPKNVNIYHELYHRIYKNIYSKLRGLYRIMDDIESNY